MPAKSKPKKKTAKQQAAIDRQKQKDWNRVERKRKLKAAQARVEVPKTRRQAMAASEGDRMARELQRRVSRREANEKACSDGNHALNEISRRKMDDKVEFLYGCNHCTYVEKRFSKAKVAIHE